MIPTQNEPEQPLNASSSGPVIQTPPQKATNKLLVLVVTAGVVLLAIIVVLLVLLLHNSTPATTAKSSSASPSSSQAANSEKIVATVPSKQANISIILYQPKQNGTTTTFDFALKNTCKGCQQKTFTSLDKAFNYDLKYPQVVTYLTNSAGDTKYGPALDADGNLRTCNVSDGYIAAGKQINCFVIFTKVPDNTSVNFFSGQFEADNILVP